MAFRELQTLGCSDMIPLSVMDEAEQPPSGKRGIVEEVEREPPVGRRIEQAGMEKLDAGEDEGRPAAFLAPVEGPQMFSLGIDEKIAGAFITDGVGRPLQEQQRIHPVVVPGAGQTLGRRGFAVTPDDIAVDDKERPRSQLIQGLLDAAAGLQQFGLRRKAYFGALPIRQVLGDHLARVMGVDDARPDSRCG